jgi:hypothetical protein
VEAACSRTREVNGDFSSSQLNSYRSLDAMATQPVEERRGVRPDEEQKHPKQRMQCGKGALLHVVFRTRPAVAPARIPADKFLFLHSRTSETEDPNEFRDHSRFRQAAGTSAVPG